LLPTAESIALKEGRFSIILSAQLRAKNRPIKNEAMAAAYNEANDTNDPNQAAKM
jgi:hypothetical protein